MAHPPAELKLQMNFYAISKTVRILQIGPVEPKLCKFCEIRQKFRVPDLWTSRENRLVRMGVLPKDYLFLNPEITV